MNVDLSYRFIKQLKKTPKEKFYVVEADCDRPEEGKFLASFSERLTRWRPSPMAPASASTSPVILLRSIAARSGSRPAGRGRVSTSVYPCIKEPSL